MTVNVSLFCQDIEAQMAFYQRLFGWPEREAERSPIYRALQASNCIVGFHAPVAVDLLGLSGLAAGPAEIQTYPTIELDTVGDVDAAGAKAVELGAQHLKGPFATYYGQWQIVLLDPERHLFRIACRSLPPGVTAPTLALP